MVEMRTMKFKSGDNHNLEALSATQKKREMGAFQATIKGSAAKVSKNKMQK